MEPIKHYLSTDFWESEEAHSFLEPTPNLPEISGAIYFKTSGSSGDSKLVVHSKRTLLASAQLVVEWLNISSDDCWYLALPIHHVGGFGVLARSYVSSCKVVEHHGKWNATQCLIQMRSTDVTIISLVPTQVYDLVKEKLPAPSSLRAVIVGGGKIEPSLKKQAIELGWNILETYGMSETGSMIATQRCASEKGIELIKGWEARVNSQGLLEIKGPGLMHGYAIKMADGFVLQQPFQDGWFTTSDKMELSDNRLIFQERNDRVVKILGELVNLEAYENELKERIGSELVIIDVHDARRGALLVPVIENESASIALENHLMKTSAPKGPRELCKTYLCPQFPRNELGKLDRQSLRDSIVKFRQSS